MRPLRVAMIGQRGVPATWGGIEHHVEEIGARLAARGHHVTVFCRRGYTGARGATHRGMELRPVPTVASKHLEAILHSGLCSLRAVAGAFDVVHYHALGPGLLAAPMRLAGDTAVVQTVHGRDDRRAKWGRAARSLLRAGAWSSARVPHETIAVSEHLGYEYARRYGTVVHHVPNGVRPVHALPPGEVLARLGVEAGRYVLFVGRLVPEKAPDLLVRAFAGIPDPGLRLVVAGGSSHTDPYVSGLQRLAGADARVLLPGWVTGRALDELYANAACFVLPSELEGMPLTLLEAASVGTPVVASSIPPHVEVLRAAGPGRRVFRTGDGGHLREVLRTVLADPEAERAGARSLRAEVLARFDWDRVADRTEEIYRRALAVGRRGRGHGTLCEPVVNPT